MARRERQEKKKKSKKKPRIKELSEKARLTYSESARINIADYEHRDIFLSVSDEPIEGETSSECLTKLRRFVQSKLYEQERQIRRESREFVDFQTVAKLR